MTSGAGRRILEGQLFCMEKEPGFTLVEMLVAMAIIGILAGVAIPAFSVWLPNYRLKSAALDVFSDLQLAKMDAIRANGNHTVTFSTAGSGSYQVTGPSGTVKTVNLSGYGSGIAYGRPASHGADAVNYTSDKVTFSSRGLADQAGEVYLKNDKGRYYQISTTLTGVVRLKKWNGTAFE